MTPNSSKQQLVALSQWRETVGVSPVTTWRWQRRGWLKTINIAGKQYVSAEMMEEFLQRARAGEFAQVRSPRPQPKSK